MDFVLAEDFSTTYTMKEDGTYTPHQLFVGLSLSKEGTFNPTSMGTGQIDQTIGNGLMPLLSQTGDERSNVIINSLFFYQIAIMQYVGLASLSRYEWVFLSANIDEKSWTYLFYQFENYKLRMMQADEGKIYTIDDQVFTSGD